MTDREKLIELVSDVRRKITAWHTAEDIADMLISNGVTFQKWIPVSERLPEKDGDYLCFKSRRYGGWREVVGFAKDGGKVNEYDLGGCENVWYGYDSEYGYIFFNSVTHWMPLPEPPKEDMHD